MRLPLLFASVLTLSGVSAAAPLTEKDLANRIGKALPGIEVGAVTRSPVDGLYEVALEGDVVYISADGRYVLKGDLLELDSRRNLSAEHRGQVRLKALKALPPETMIEFAPEDTRHVLYVYTDIDCGYCRKFHQQVLELNKAGIAVRYLAFPRAGVGSASFAKSISVWCAKDRQKALTDAKSGKPVSPATCDNAVERHYDLGQRMGVQGTPTLITDTGEELGGYVPAKQLVQFFKGKAGS
jgi:thiol:disulfide interchange protein DsbC